MSGVLPQHQGRERVRDRLIAASLALDDFLPDEDLRDLMDWLDGERLYAAGRGETGRAAAFAEVQRELRERRLVGGDAPDRSVEAVSAVLKVFLGDDDEEAEE